MGVTSSLNMEFGDPIENKRRRNQKKVQAFFVFTFYVSYYDDYYIHRYLSTKATKKKKKIRTLEICDFKFV